MCFNKPMSSFALRIEHLNGAQETSPLLINQRQDQPPDERERIHIWRFANKFFFMFVLLLMSVWHLSLLGGVYFLLFLLHNLTYSTFRGHNRVIDRLVVQSYRNCGKTDLRSLFQYSQLAVTGLLVLGLAVNQVILLVKGQNESPALLKKLVPEIDSLLTVLRVFATFVFATAYLWTRQWEDKERETNKGIRDNIANFLLTEQGSTIVKFFGGTEELKIQTSENQSPPASSPKIHTSAARYSSSELSPQETFLKDLLGQYNLNVYLLLAVQMMTLCLISTIEISAINAPYQVIFAIQCYLLAVFRMKTVVEWCAVFNKILLVMVVGELLSQYGLYLFQQDAAKQVSYRRLLGLITEDNPTSFVVFGLKILLLIVESQRVQSAYSVQSLHFLEPIRDSRVAELLRTDSLWRRSLSFVGQFMFCNLSIAFALANPSVFFLPLVPILSGTFFLKFTPFKWVSFTTISVYLVQTIGIYTLIFVLLWNDPTLNRDSPVPYTYKLFGVRNFEDQSAVLPGRTQFVQLLTISFFCRYALKANGSYSDFQELQRTSPKNLPMRENEEKPTSSDPKWQDKCKEVFAKIGQSLMNLFIIHVPKVALVALFVVTVMLPNLFNILMMFVYLRLTTQNNERYRDYWRFTIFLVAAFLSVQYVLFVVLKSEVLQTQEPNSFLCYSGLVYCKPLDLGNFLPAELFNFLPYYSLLAVFVLNLQFLESSSYKNLVTEYVQCELQIQHQRTGRTCHHERHSEKLKVDKPFEEDQGRPKAMTARMLPPIDNFLRASPDEAEAEEFFEIEKEAQDEIKESSLVYDPLSRFVFKFALYFQLLALAFSCVFLPLSLNNCVLMLLTSVLTVKALRQPNQAQLYQNNTALLHTISLVAEMSIFIRYIVEFCVSFNLTYSEGFKDQWTLALGYSEANFAVRLFNFAIIKLLAQLQLYVQKDEILLQIVKEFTTEWSVKTKPFNFFQRWLLIYPGFLLSQVLPILLLTGTFLYGVWNLSLLGLLLCLSSWFLLWKHASEFWANSYKALGILLSVFASLLYLADFMLQVFKDVYSDQLDLEAQRNFFVNLLKSNLEYFENDETLYSVTFWAIFGLLAVCFVQQRSESTFKTLFFNSEREFSTGQGSLILDESFARESETFNYEEPLRICAKLKTFFKIFYFSAGQIIVMFALLLVMMLKADVTSFGYLVLFYWIKTEEYYPSRFEQIEEDQRTKKERQHRNLKWVIGFTSFLTIWRILVQLVIKFHSKEEESLETIQAIMGAWSSFFQEKICFMQENPKSDGNACLNDWNIWLTVSKEETATWYFLIEYLLLVLTYCTHFFTSEEFALERHLTLTPPKPGDENDFTRGSLSEQRLDKIHWMLTMLQFSYTPYVLLIVMFVAVSTFNGDGYSNFISCCYLIMSLYCVLKFNKLYQPTHNKTVLKVVWRFSFVVLTAFCIYQMPLFPCPHIWDGENANQNFYYIPASMCRSNSPEEELHDHVYPIFIHMMGLEKLAANGPLWPLLAIVIVLELQVWTFHHPYFNEYVVKRWQTNKLDARMQSFIFIQRHHLRLYWAYKLVKTQAEINLQRLEEIAKKTLGTKKIIKKKTIGLIKRFKNPKVMKFVQERETVEMIEKFLLKNLTPGLPVVSYQKFEHKLEEHLLDDDNWHDYIESDFRSNRSEDESFSKPQDLSKRHPTEVPGDTDKESLQNFDQNKSPKTQQDYASNNLSEGEKAVSPSLQLFLKIATAGLRIKDKAKLEQLFYRLLEELRIECYRKDSKKLFSRNGLGMEFAKEFVDEYLAVNNQLFYTKIFDKYTQDEEFRVSEANDFELLPIQQEVIETGQATLHSEQTPFTVRESEPKKGPSTFDSYILDLKFALLRYCDIVVSTSQNKQLTEESLKFYLPPSPELVSQTSLRKLLSTAAAMQTPHICFLLIFAQFAFNPDILGLVLPLMILFYALLEPTDQRFWRVALNFQIFIILLKFAVQLPMLSVQCLIPFLENEECSSNSIEVDVLVTRVDHIVGLEKYTGPTSYPYNQGILLGMLWDFALLIALIANKNYMIKSGMWVHVLPDRDIEISPKFVPGKKLGEAMQRLQKEERLDKGHFSEEIEFNFPEQKQSQSFIGRYVQFCKDFSLKLNPRYKHHHKPGSPTKRVNFKVNKYKPGKDFFVGNFFSLFLLLMYVLFFYKSSTLLKNDQVYEIDLDRFTSWQVLLMFSLFMLMLLERMLYRTRKVLLGNEPQRPYSKYTNDIMELTLTIKCCLYVLLVIWVHIDLGFVLPINQGTSMGQHQSLLVYYFLWVLHLVFAALQIKHGYPCAPYKQTFSSDTSLSQYVLFKVFRVVPFLWEMRVIIDWTVTATCLDLFQWFRIEDAYLYLYYNKYLSDTNSKRKEFEPRSFGEKCVFGFCAALALILLILFPVILFSGYNPIVVENPVHNGSLQLMFELQENGNDYQVIFTQAYDPISLTQTELVELNTMFNREDPDIDPSLYQKLHYSTFSDQNWQISQPSLTRFQQDFQAFEKSVYDPYIKITVKLFFSRNGPLGNEQAQYVNTIKVPMAEMQPVIDLLTVDKPANVTTATVDVVQLLPKMLKLDYSKDVHTMAVSTKGDVSQMTSLQIQLTKTENNSMYWTFALSPEDMVSPFKQQGDSTHSENDSSSSDLVIVLYNERVISSLFGSAASMSVVGFYVTLVYAAGSFLRLVFDRYSERVIYEERPDCEKLFEIFEGIFIAQLQSDLHREKQLYDILIRVYRSPEAMLKMTGERHKYLPEDNEDPLALKPKAA